MTGLVEDVSEEHGDFFIKFMHPHGPSKLFFWPNTDDTCWVQEADILCIIGTPSLASSRRMYSLINKMMSELADCEQSG